MTDDLLRERDKDILRAEEALRAAWETVSSIHSLFESTKNDFSSITTLFHIGPLLSIRTSHVDEREALCRHAKKLCDGLSTAEPNSLEKAVICYCLAGEHQKGYEISTRILRNNENKIQWFYYAAAICAQAFDHYEMATHLYQKILKTPTTESLPDIQMRLAIGLRDGNHLNEALETFKALIEHPPKGLVPDDIKLQIAYTYQLIGDKENTRDILNDLIKAHPNSEEVLLQLCWHLMFQKKLEDNKKALFLLHKMEGKFLSSAEAIFIEAHIFIHEENLQYAYARFHAIHTLWSESALFWIELGVLYFRNQQYQNAKDSFEKALLIDENFAEAWINYGVVLQTCGEMKEARQIFQKGLSICPDSKDLKERLDNISSTRTPTVVEVSEETFCKAWPITAERAVRNFLNTTPLIPSSMICSSELEESTLEKLKIEPVSLFNV